MFPLGNIGVFASDSVFFSLFFYYGFFYLLNKVPIDGAGPLKFNVESFLVSPKTPVNKFAPGSFFSAFFYVYTAFFYYFLGPAYCWNKPFLSFTPKTGTFPPNDGNDNFCSFVYFLTGAVGSFEIVLADVSGTSISSALSAAYEAFIDYYFLFYFFGKFGGINFLSSIFDPTNA